MPRYIGSFRTCRAFIGHPAPVPPVRSAAGSRAVGRRWAWRCAGLVRQACGLPRAQPRTRPTSPACSYALVRRTRRRGGVVRGTAVLAGCASPATRRRLCVLRQIGDELIPGLEEFLFVDDVVAVEDGAGLVAGQEHGDALGHAGADQVAGGGAAAIVEEAGRHPGRLAGRAPRRAPAADGDAVAVEDQRTRRGRAVPAAARGPRQWVAK